MPKKTSKQQVAYLLSKKSPLSDTEKKKFEKELREGKSKVVK